MSLYEKYYTLMERLIGAEILETFSSSELVVGIANLKIFIKVSKEGEICNWSRSVQAVVDVQQLVEIPHWEVRVDIRACQIFNAEDTSIQEIFEQCSVLVLQSSHIVEKETCFASPDVVMVDEPCPNPSCWHCSMHGRPAECILEWLLQNKYQIEDN